MATSRGPAVSHPRLLISGLGLANVHVGQGVYARRIIEGLLRLRPDLSFKVIAPAHFRGLAEWLPAKHLDLLAGRPPHAHEMIAAPWWAQRIVAHAARSYPDATLHSPSIMMAWRSTPRMVVTLHDCIYRSFPLYLGRWRWRRWLFRLSERHAARGAMVFTDSEFSARDLAARAGIPREKLRVLYPWVDERSRMEQPSPSELQFTREKLGLPPRFWLYLGGYDYRKNVETLVAAYAMARTGGASVPPLVLAGRVPPAEAADVYCNVHAVLDRARLPKGAVLMPGFVEPRDLPALLCAAALLIFPSLMEGFGLPPAEAMAVGTPVLSADNSSLPEVVRNPACRFDAGRPETLRALLESVAGGGEERFRCPLPAEFTEAFGVQRYLELLGLSS